ncbi:pyridoxamine 5'-phosphate oxidase family protein [Halococcus saccharolyticus]|uniref:Pyridoxamine 5'-phosphate oxidase-like FMN-binding protein n=1 Tax=Halococcus saccharolyticus DSM 5350 TaxID=1227455 RepID=M0MT51_9EURY|nr:pyridoxamine 5'-phosphate oxidase family protein [Halococcus saccharolyticus]EMA47924.1 pyridoxamine 5'-phosphate oxidase-like FMN- binding protein [Halococcus saccharolyticus DSM 5350]
MIPSAEPANATRERPHTESSYGIPDDEKGLLSWTFVADRLRENRNFWVSTTLPDGGPHARPVWGVYTEETFYCGGGERTRWVRNLAADPRVVVHSESGDEVVILEGRVEHVDEGTATQERIERVDAAYERKYGIEHGTPFFAVRPERVLAWNEYPTDATRWTFAEHGV